MTDRERRYVETHRGGERILSRLHQIAAARDAPVEPLAAELGMPPAAVRAARSFYDDLHQPPAVLRVCRGTSCALAGAASLQAALQRESDCRSVYCLGYCDRSPVVLRGDDEIVLRCTGAPLSARSGDSTPAAPAMRSLVAEPILLRRVMRGGAVGLAAARAQGVYAALDRALRAAPADVLETVERSGERGRGGAGFSTATKWRSCRATPADVRYVIANGDEGDPGSFVDRVLMEGDPHAVIEGLALGGYAAGASHGIVFIRSEYPTAIAVMTTAIGEARRAGILGSQILGSGFDFDIEIVRGMGSYVCGEETALLNAIEGFRGEVRLRPPYPSVAGLFGKPTVVNNVETLVNVPAILTLGAQAYAALGTPTCSGTKALCLNHGFARPGIVEVEFGTLLRRVIDDAGGGSGGRRLEAVLVGGPMGSVVLPEQWDVPVCYTAMAERGIQLGHGGLVAVPEGTDFRALLLHWATFLRDESCGKCVPCRLGSQRAHGLLQAEPSPRAELERLLEVIAQGSLCAFGQRMPQPMRELIDAFGDRIFARPS